MIHPIEERYRTAVADIFEENNKIALMCCVEVALAKAHWKNGVLTKGECKKIARGAKTATLEMAKEVRNLQRTELHEIAEPFSAGQIGSSTMPHKRNPHKSENACSIAKRLRTNILPALKNISLEHERDLTNSANEHIIIPETIILTHYMLEQVQFIFSNLTFFEKQIQKNLQLESGILMEKKMMELFNQGFGRQDAYERAKQVAPSVNPKEYVGLSAQIVDEVIDACAAFLA